MASKLNVYERNEEERDFVVAESPEDAVAMMRLEETQTKPEEWKLYDKPTLTIVNWDDNGGRATKTPEEWVALNGRGHLACSYA